MRTLARIALIASLAIGAAVVLDGCGKRQSELDAPKGSASQYPRQYPSW